MRRIARFVAVALAMGVTAAGASTAAADPLAADLAIQLGAVGTALPMARYDLSVTNNGPDALESATVVIQLDPRAFQPTSTPCVFNAGADTLTCSFSNLAAGATASNSSWVYFQLPQPATIDATATRTSSTPADPNAQNDSDSHRCIWPGPAQILLPPGVMRC